MPPAMKSLRPAVPFAATSRRAAATSVGACEATAAGSRTGPTSTSSPYSTRRPVGSSECDDAMNAASAAVLSESASCALPARTSRRAAAPSVLTYRTAMPLCRAPGTSTACTNPDSASAAGPSTVTRRASLPALAAAGSAAATSRQASKRRTTALSARERPLSRPYRLASHHASARARRPAARGARGRDRVDHALRRHASGGTALAARERRARACDPRIPALPAERRDAGGRPPADDLVRRARLWLRPRRHPRHGQLGRDHRGRILRAGATRRARGDRLAGRAALVRRAGRHGRDVVERIQRAAARGAHAAGARRGDQHLRERRSLRRRRPLPRRARDPDGHGPVGELHAVVERAPARPGDRGRRLALAVARAARAHAAFRGALARASAPGLLLAA